jgi:hypothetical protein
MSGSIGSNSNGDLELYSGSTKVLTAHATTGVTDFVKTPTAPTPTAGANDTQVATTAMVHAAITNDLHVTGAAPMYACRAWVNFDGTQSTPSIRGSGNISSVTKNGTGNYTMSFTTAMPDVKYVSVFGGRNNGDGNGCWLAEYGDPSTQAGKTTTSLTVANYKDDGTSLDMSTFMTTIFR